eukprot:comp15836_c0_seq1/m.13156 comp15836_c0_seq1/g.13156  ORF comp15836_c0_seq1/g.13156 comp15836_c0_seq1/m.13156 type:complete len:259 (-) comp15836_c0_seq1:311-1087(-)
MALKFKCDVTETWKRVLGFYDEAMQALSKTKKEPTKLLQLDSWYRDELPGVIQKRDPPHMTQEELSKLMQWKLMRGKFRPRLQDMVQSNGDALVKETSKKAFSLAPADPKKAIDELCKLKAVGPATASAILCAATNGDIPFMADESMEGVDGLGPIAYTASYYAKFSAALKTKAKQLSENDTSGKQWTPHEVELALWTSRIAAKHNIDIDTSVDTAEKEKPSSKEEKDEEKGSKKRKEKDGEEVKTSANIGKRQKRSK